MGRVAFRCGAESQMRILIIEDDLEAAEAMKRGLTEAGYDCLHAPDGVDGLAAAQKGGFDVLIVDRMMPRMDGVTVVETLRREGDATPVLFLSALGEIQDRVTGLKAGGDDYLVKPYAFPELMARVEALSRRRETGAVATTLKVGELEMNLIARTVHRSGTEIDLQPREFQLLEFMMRHAGQSVTRTMLLEKVWEYHFDPQTNVIDVHISRLRSKIDKGFDRPMLQTVRGAGYRLDP
jgi:two-component system OmpR family response regulator